MQRNFRAVIAVSALIASVVLCGSAISGLEAGDDLPKVKNACALEAAVQMGPDLAVKHPMDGQKDIPRKFVVYGTFRGRKEDFRQIYGLVENTKKPTQKQVRLHHRIYKKKAPTGDHTHRWLMIFDLSDPTQFDASKYKLTVTGLPANKEKISYFYLRGSEKGLKGTKGPAPIYPEDMHLITKEEQEYFVAYGTKDGAYHVEMAVVEDESDEMPSNAAETIMHDGNFWITIFPPLAAATVENEPRVFRAVDENSGEAKVNVKIEK